MCFEFGSCFGGGRTDDYGGQRPKSKEEHGGGRRGNHGSRYNGGGDAADPKPAPKGASHRQPPAAVNEAGHKAYHDGAGGRGRYTAYPQLKADIEAPKLPAWHNKVSGDAYTARLQEAAGADHRYNAAMDYLHYPTTTTTITLGRY